MFTKRNQRQAMLVASLAAAACMLGSAPSAAQQPDEPLAPASVYVEPYSTTTTGCGNATSIGSGNVAVLYVDGYPCEPADYPDWDQPYTNIKVCAPGSTTNCQVFDHIIVDSGSDGVRLVSSVIKSSLQKALPIVTEGGFPLTECEIYVSSFTYGPLKRADIYIAGKVVKNYPMQVLGASGFPIPTDCSSQGGTPTNDAVSFDSKGLVGVAFNLTDTGIYYDCDPNGTNCQQSGFAGMPNLVSKFASDNNGVVIKLPAIPSHGTTGPVMGSLVFGVGTQNNNKPPTGTIPLLNDANGQFRIAVNAARARAYIDSGTNDLVINGPWKQCTDGSGYYCPNIPTAISMGVYSFYKTQPAFHMNFTIANGSQLLSFGNVAYDDIASVANSSSSLPGDYGLGLATFFGRTMYFVFDGKNSTLGAGPINAVYPQK